MASGVPDDSHRSISALAKPLLSHLANIRILRINHLRTPSLCHLAQKQVRGRQQSTDRPEQHNTLINPVLPMRADSVKSFRVLRAHPKLNAQTTGCKALDRLQYLVGMDSIIFGWPLSLRVGEPVLVRQPVHHFLERDPHCIFQWPRAAKRRDMRRCVDARPGHPRRLIMQRHAKDSEGFNRIGSHWKNGVYQRVMLLRSIS